LLLTAVVHCYVDDTVWLVRGEWIKKTVFRYPGCQTAIILLVFPEGRVRTKVLLAGTVPARCICYVSGSCQSESGKMPMPAGAGYMQFGNKTRHKVTKDQPCR
jgi:hypothetical protein